MKNELQNPLVRKRLWLKDYCVIAALVFFFVAAIWAFASSCALFPETTAQLEETKRIAPQEIDKKGAGTVQKLREEGVERLEKL